jgi:hypothetical protein
MCYWACRLRLIKKRSTSLIFEVLPTLFCSSATVISMTDASSSGDRTDGGGRRFICEAISPDGIWHVEVFGPNNHTNYPRGYAKKSDSSWPWQFSFGRKPVSAEQISFRWDLPNGAWGVYVDGECWVVCVTRQALRMRPTRIHSRGGDHAIPYSEEEIKFMCAKRRGQKPGTKGFVIEE